VKHGSGGDVFADGRTLYYRVRSSEPERKRGSSPIITNLDTGEDYWISGTEARRRRSLYGGSTPIEIDDDVREEVLASYQTAAKRSRNVWHDSRRADSASVDAERAWPTAPRRDVSCTRLCSMV